MVNTTNGYGQEHGMDWTARDLMQEDLATVGALATIDQALAVLLERDTGEVFVTDPERRLLGVVPEYELLKARLSGLCPETGIEKVMSRSLVTVTPDQRLDDLAASFRECRNWQLPVVERGHLLGCVGRRDLLRVMAEHNCAVRAPRLPRFLRTKSNGDLQPHSAG